MEFTFPGFKVSGIKEKNEAKIEKLIMLPTGKKSISHMLGLLSGFFSKTRDF